MPGGLLDLLTAQLGDIVNAVTSVIDDVITNDEERMRAKAELEKVLQARHLKVLENAAATTEAQRDIVVAELQQDDLYTKRARPTVIYGGLVTLFLNEVLLPWLAHFTATAIPTINLPSEFWWAWGGVVATYAVGRTMEKRSRLNGSLPGRIVKAITG